MTCSDPENGSVKQARPTASNKSGTGLFDFGLILNTEFSKCRLPYGVLLIGDFAYNEINPF